MKYRTTLLGPIKSAIPEMNPSFRSHARQVNGREKTFHSACTSSGAETAAAPEVRNTSRRSGKPALRQKAPSTCKCQKSLSNLSHLNARHSHQPRFASSWVGIVTRGSPHIDCSHHANLLVGERESNVCARLPKACAQPADPLWPCCPARPPKVITQIVY